MQAKQDQFKLLKIIHLAIVGGLTAFTIVLILFTRKSIAAPFPLLDRNYQLISIAISLLCILFGLKIFKRKLLVVHHSTGPAVERMQFYRSALIVLWAMIEGPGLVAAMGLFITGNYAFVALAFMHIVILVLFMPRKDNIIVLLKLNEKETTVLGGK